MAKRNLAELKIPASSAFIPVAKRVATTLGGQMGFSLVDLDELTIALTQACDSAIEAANDLTGRADLKLTYFKTNRALVVDVDDHPEVLDTLRELDALALPVVVTSTGHWTGYRPDQIRALTLTTTQEGSR